MARRGEARQGTGKDGALRIIDQIIAAYPADHPMWSAEPEEPTNAVRSPWNPPDVRQQQRMERVLVHGPEIARLRATGMTWAAIGRQIGRKGYTCQRWHTLFLQGAA